MTKGCRKWRNRFKRGKFVVLSEYLEQQANYHRYKRKIRKSRRGPWWRMNQSYLFTFPYQTYGNYATELSTVGQVISGRHWKGTFDFAEIVNNYGLKRGTVCLSVRFNSHFSLLLYFSITISITIHSILEIF